MRPMKLANTPLIGVGQALADAADAACFIPRRDDDRQFHASPG